MRDDLAAGTPLGLVFFPETRLLRFAGEVGQGLIRGPGLAVHLSLRVRLHARCACSSLGGEERGCCLVGAQHAVAEASLSADTDEEKLVEKVRGLDL